MPESGIERRIVTGMVVSDDYLARAERIWRDEWIESPELRRVATWCLDYHRRYGRAPDNHIEDVFLDRMRAEPLPKAEAELVENVLRAISDEYGRGDRFNAEYLWDRTIEHLRERALALHTERVEDLRERGRIAEAEVLAAEFRPSAWGVVGYGLEVGSEEGYSRVAAAFDQAAKSIIEYPNAAGDLLNGHLVRGGFVSLLGPRKRGKTFFLMDLSTRALRDHCNVAFFQAGDMTEPQMLRRLAIHLAGRSDDPRYCRPYWRAVGDCARNQFDACDRPDRNCDHGVRNGGEAAIDGFLEHRAEYEERGMLAGLAVANPDYATCRSYNCAARIPTVWVERQEERRPLTGPDAKRHVQRFFERWRRRLRLATYPSGTLTCEEISLRLSEWVSAYDFVADVIVVDYADLMTASVTDFRHRQDAIWRGLRGISQERHALLVTATQADAASQRQTWLGPQNFSEDVRKLAHVTAMFGLNRDPTGREEQLGIMRLNAIVVREGEGDSDDSRVVVLQDLRAGRPLTSSYPWRGSGARDAPDDGDG